MFSLRALAGLVALGCAVAAPLRAETLDLGQALERALESDPRIEELRHVERAARALVAEVEGHGDWFVEGDFRLALTTSVDGSPFKNGGCEPGDCELRDDRYSIDGLSPWFFVKVAVVKPLLTFGKLENYSEAARAYAEVKRGDIRLRQGATVMEVKKAYYGYLAARDSRRLFDDVARRLQGAIDLTRQWLDEGEGDVSQADLYALESGMGMVGKYRAQAGALEKVALDGLKVVTGIGLDHPLEVVDRRLRPLPLPQESLEALQQWALAARPEMAQLESGLRARRALLEARRAEEKPNVYAGVAGLLSVSPGRERLDNPYLYDPFNDAGLTPFVGMQWKWSGATYDARVEAARAQLDALVEKAAFARQGIPFQVAEQYHQVHGFHEAVEQAEQAARSARRWMIASYTDFEAGFVEAEKVLTAFQGYVLAATDYIKTTYEYNMHLARLDDVVGRAVPKEEHEP